MKAKLWLGALALSLVALPGTAIAQSYSKNGEDILYTVKKGDSLIGLAARFMVTADSYKIVQAQNRLANPHQIPVGRVIAIPTRLLKSTPVGARVIAFQGQTSISGIRQLSIGAQIEEGALLQTGPDGFLTFELATGSRVSLPSKSTMRIRRLRRYLLTGGFDIDFAVDRGRAETRVVPLADPKNRYLIRTPIAVSAVRGTVFRIGYDEGGAPSLTEVVEGNVAVNATAVETAADVPAGFGVAASASGALDKEALLPPPAMITPGKVQQQPQISFALQAGQGEAGYHVQIARDAGFIDIVAGMRSTTPAVQFDGLPDGVYFVRAMAIAPSGLEGLSETFSFKRQMTAVSASAVDGQPDAFRFAWQGQGETKAIYRLQLFRADKPGQPLVDMPGLEAKNLTISGLQPGVYTWRVGVTRFSDEGIERSWTPLEKLTVSP